MSEAAHFRLREAAPALILLLIGAMALVAVSIAAPSSLACGESPTPGHAAAVTRFRDVAFWALAAAAAAWIILVAYLASRDHSRLAEHEHPIRGLFLFVVLLVLALLFPVTRWFLMFGAITTGAVPLMPAVALAGLSLVAFVPMPPSLRPAFTGAVAAAVLTLLAMLSLWTVVNDGGPIYC